MPELYSCIPDDIVALFCGTCYHKRKAVVMEEEKMTEDKIMIENTDETIPEFSKAIETKTEETKAEEANEVKEETAGKVEVKENAEVFSREQWILSKIRDEDLMEYLRMEDEKERRIQQAKELKEKRIFIGFQMLFAMLSVVIVVYLLQDNPTVLINILYLMGIVAVLWLWRKPKEQ